MSQESYWGVLRRPNEGVFCCTHYPTTRARAGALASVQAMPAGGMTRPGGESGGRSGWQSHLS
eukprot:scaffold6279_cov228-Isochrysis_galbana.AAC.11